MTAAADRGLTTNPAAAVLGGGVTRRTGRQGCCLDTRSAAFIRSSARRPNAAPNFVRGRVEILSAITCDSARRPFAGFGFRITRKAAFFKSLVIGHRITLCNSASRSD